MPRISPVRFAVVGLGMGRAHAGAALKVPEVDLVAIAEPDVGRFEHFVTTVTEGDDKRAAKAVAKIQRFDDYKAMVTSGICEAVSLALPTDMHFDATRFCLKQGVHVICEKPPTTQARQMRTIARMVKDTGLSYAFVRQQRFDPKKFTVRELALSGKLGTVYHGESHWLRSRGVPFRGGWGVNKDAGGGVLLDLGIHKVDDAWFCMGNPVPESAYAAMHCRFDFLAEKLDLSMHYNADDFSAGMIRFADGASLSMSASFAGNRVSVERQAEGGVIGNCDWQELIVQGNKAGVDLNRGRITRHHAKGVKVEDLKIPARITRMRGGFAGLFTDVALAIRNGSTPLNSATHALQLMEMLEALRTSAETGRAVGIKPVD